MDIEERVATIRSYLMEFAFCTEESEIADQLEILICGCDPIKLYQLSMNAFSRFEAELLFVYTASTWGRFTLNDLEVLISGLDRSDNTSWGADHGGFCDICFLTGTLRLNAFRIASNAMCGEQNFRKIVEYGINNLAILLNESDDECDEYESYTATFSECREEMRSSVISANPTLDILDWSIDDLEKDLANLIKVNAIDLRKH